MGSKEYYIVDVFAEEKYCGNQLAVFTDGSQFSDKEMQQIAREINFSETTFITSDKDKENFTFGVRIFTPMAEMPFAGHPTLGTAFILQQKIIERNVPKVTLDLKVGKIPVTIQYKDNYPEKMTMKQIEPSFGKRFGPDNLAGVLNIVTADIDERFPIEEVSTGLPDILVPLKTLSAVKKVSINLTKYYQLIENLESKAIMVFCPETYHKQNHINARMFADYFGVPEDPATGSVNGALAGYLVKHRYFGSEKIDIRVEQGYEMGRPSLLHLTADETDGRINIYVGGKSILMARGEWL